MMAQEMEFLMYGVIVLGVWTILACLTAVCWSLWNWKVGPSPPSPSPVDWSKWKFKYTETAPPVRSVLRLHRTDNA